MVYAGEEDELYPLVNEGLALYRARRWFDAHEVWEHAWNGEVGRNKETLRALIQVAAALHKHEEGNRRGPSKLLAKAKNTLAEVTSGCSSWLGFDLVALGAAIDRALADADAWANEASQTIAAPELPPATGPHGIVYLHGFASGPSSFKANAIVPELRSAGYSVQVPDLNEDDFEGLTVTRSLAFAKRLLRDRTVVIGSSLGGYVAGLLAEKDERVKALVLMAPAFDIAARMKRRYGTAAIEAWKTAGRTMVEHYTWGGRHAIGYGFLEDAERYAAFPKIRVPTYLLQGTHDTTVPPDLATEFAEAHPQHVELDLADDDHGLKDSVERAYAAVLRMIARAGIEPSPPGATIEAAERRLAEIDLGKGPQ
jgi:uncharacterized protein